MNLFPRIFLTFFCVIISALLMAGLSYRAVQQKIAENRFKQQRSFEIGLMHSAIAVFQTRGINGMYETLQDWHNTPSFHNILIIAGDSKQDIFHRAIDPIQLAQARKFAARHPETRLVRIVYDHLGEEYIFMLRDWPQTGAPHPSLLSIPGLDLPPVWHESLVLLFIITVGLLLSYILAQNISQPIKTLRQGMDALANGLLDTRIGHRLSYRKDELAQLALQFDEMAIQLQQLIEKEKHLLHHVSHEMRSPLARMQAILALIQVQPERQSQNIQRLESELTRMDNLVDELLTLSRLEASHIEIKKSPVELIGLLTQILEDSRLIASQNQQHINFTYPPNCQQAIVLADETYLYRAFDNVIRNAMAYSPSGSRIDITLDTDDKNYLIDISDNGPGVAENQLPHIFTAFYRADSGAHKQGTGLGLAIARHVAVKHGGNIQAQNAASGGLIVRFHLPMANAS